MANNGCKTYVIGSLYVVTDSIAVSFVEFLKSILHSRLKKEKTYFSKKLIKNLFKSDLKMFTLKPNAHVEYLSPLNFVYLG